MRFVEVTSIANVKAFTTAASNFISLINNIEYSQVILHAGSHQNKQANINWTGFWYPAISQEVIRVHP